MFARSLSFLLFVGIVTTMHAGPPVGTGENAMPANAGFETYGPQGMPEHWKVEGELPAGVRPVVDPKVFHSGSVSLKLSLAAAGSITLISPEFTLQVGHLYRLSGWIRTEKAFSDATSRYPTALPACLSMNSFPFTNSSPALGATYDWTRIQVPFIATKSKDRVRLHLGFNGNAVGTAWFDDLAVEKLEDIAEFIPSQTVRWFGPAYRYDDGGWIQVHIEGEPYERGYQYGFLLSREIVQYAQKLAHQQNPADAAAGWQELRFQIAALMLRRFEDEYLYEMKGIADGAAAAGAKLYDQAPDLTDIAVLNAIVDLRQMREALPRTANAVSGVNFLKTEDELRMKEENHKCSAFAATGSATVDGRFVFGQLFMWNGYTGLHWDVLCDVRPSRGYRFVQQTFPGGIHSGSDFYISQSGLVIGETTVAQTPYNEKGTPQSNRIRKAIQYSRNIDQLVETMIDRNNGQYTNEWPFADTKSNEVGIFLLGTDKYRLWRSEKKDFPGGLTDFYWCNNNNKDLEVRKEYVVSLDNAPYDLAFRPWNRDLVFQDFYKKFFGRMDSIAGVNLWASSPVNRPHACDGKITTAEMAEQLVFLAHYGKVTLREKWVGGRVPQLPGAEPHLSLGYSVSSPLFITRKLQEIHAGESKKMEKAIEESEYDLSAAKDTYGFEKRRLWRGTIYPPSPAEYWLSSASAAYWRMLNDLPQKSADAVRWLDSQLADLNIRYLYLLSREGDIVPVKAEERFDRYRDYQAARIRGTYALHQLRLRLGNERFQKVMNGLYRNYAGKDADNASLMKAMNTEAGDQVSDFLGQWLQRDGLPDPKAQISIHPAEKGEWQVRIRVEQPAGNVWHLLGNVDIHCDRRIYRRPMELQGEKIELLWTMAQKPTRILFNSGSDFPVHHPNFYAMDNLLDDFQDTLIVYGTGREIEANRSLAERWQETVADAYTETLLGLRKDCEITREEKEKKDLMILGQAGNNSLLQELADRFPGLKLGKNMFRWNGKEYTSPEDGLVVAFPSPYGKNRVVYLIVSNSARQLYRMTQRWERWPSWALYQGEKIGARGYHPPARFLFENL